jgi:hypothetical protein
MYTNIRTGPALHHISHLLKTEAGHSFHHYNTDALISAIEIVFQNNLIQFGDTYWQQTSGTGMGIAPAPPWATIYFAIPFYKRFIDDIIGIWLCDPCPDTNEKEWIAFKNDMQQWHGLEWEFSTPSHSCTFMDLLLTLHHGKIMTTLHEKKHNLFLYIPPHSAHPKGMLNGLIFGNILRIHRLCSNPPEIHNNVKSFYKRLLNRGYSKNTLTPIFRKATHNALTFLARTPEDHEKRRNEKSNKTKRTASSTCNTIHKTHQPETSNNSGTTLSQAHQATHTSTP